MRKLLLLLMLLQGAAGFAQTLTGDRVIARGSLYLRDRWADRFINDTSLMDHDFGLPTGGAVYRFVTGRLIGYGATKLNISGHVANRLLSTDASGNVVASSNVTYDNVNNTLSFGDGDFGTTKSLSIGSGQGTIQVSGNGMVFQVGLNEPYDASKGFLFRNSSGTNYGRFWSENDGYLGNHWFDLYSGVKLRMNNLSGPDTSLVSVLPDGTFIRRSGGTGGGSSYANGTATTQGLFWNGSTYAPRNISAADIPVLNQNTTGVADSWRGALAGIGVLNVTGNLNAELQHTTFTGTSAATITVPTAVGGKVYWIKNAGTAVLTLAGSGGQQFYDNALVSTISLQPGSSAFIAYSGSYWSVMNRLAEGIAGTLPVANGGTGATTAPLARTNLGATTLGGNFFTLPNNSTSVKYPRINADNTITQRTAAELAGDIDAATTTGTATFFNKTMSGISNTFSDIPASAISGSDVVDKNVATTVVDNSTDLVDANAVHDFVKAEVAAGGGSTGYDNEIQALRDAGSSIIAQSAAVSYNATNTTFTLTGNAMRLTMVRFSKDDTATGAIYTVVTVGNFVANNENKVVLYEYDINNTGSTVITRIAETASDSTLWKTAGYMKVPFTTPVAVKKNKIYYLGFLWGTAANPTATPALIGSSAYGNAGMASMDFTGSRKLTMDSDNNLTASPATIDISTRPGSAGRLWGGVYN